MTLSDILPTSFECGVLNGRVAPGSSVAIVGAGPIGLAALLTAQFYLPAEIIVIDLDDNRLEVAKSFGATKTVNAAEGTAAEAVMKLTGGRGVDTAIEAVGVPVTFVLCEDIVAQAGRLQMSAWRLKVDLHLERLWSQNITITTRLVDTVTTPMLLKTVQAGKIDPKRLITHHFELDQILDAYDTFGEAAAPARSRSSSRRKALQKNNPGTLQNAGPARAQPIAAGFSSEHAYSTGRIDLPQ